MDIKFVNDLKNNQMRLTIKLAKRTIAREEIVMLGWTKVKKIVEDQYKCPDTHVLGECSNPYQKMNNNSNSDSMLQRTWVFDLAPKQATKPKKVVQKKKTKKTTAKK